MLANLLRKKMELNLLEV